MTKQLLLIVLFAGVVLCDPIPVSISGEFWLSNEGGSMQVFIGGSNDTGSVSLAVEIPIGFAPPTAGFGANSRNVPALQISPMTVDGTTSMFWALSMGPDGTGFMKDLDSSGNVLAEEDIVSVNPIQVTGVFGDPVEGEWGYFSNAPVSNVPEVDSGLLAGVGIAALVTRRRVARG